MRKTFIKKEDTELNNKETSTEKKAHVNFKLNTFMIR